MITRAATHTDASRDLSQDPPQDPPQDTPQDTPQDPPQAAKLLKVASSNSRTPNNVVHYQSFLSQPLDICVGLPS